jgi:predicted ATP-dependent endonuclease of OLD family
MKLVSIELHGYKRFARLSTMNVDGKLVAVVGPNESGKSSLLAGLQHLNHREPFVNSGGSLDTTRDVSIAPEDVMVEVKCLLDDEDRAAIAHIPGTEEAHWFTLGKKQIGGRFICDIEPRPRRVSNPRHLVIQTLKEGPDEEAFLQFAEKQESTLITSVRDLASILDTEVEMLPPDTRNKLDALTRTLETISQDNDLEYLNRLKQQLRDLAAYEEKTPLIAAIQVLAERRPRFLLFTDEQRLLQPEYDLNAVHENPPAALDSLTQIAGLDLQALHNAVKNGEHARAEGITVRANKQLRTNFLDAWSQSDLTVSFSRDGYLLRLFVEHARTQYTTIAERSEGLRQFVALLAFTAVEHAEQNPVLLIDEIESHLHYDAQADLVQMLARQEIVSKVIYTTHSIGCLPEDLGMGVRLLAIDSADETKSTVRNWFWDSGKPGFSPLLFGMGASTLAFIPVRHAVATEGIVDIILWPTLLRHATSRSHLDFQVVPGISESTLPEITQLDREAPLTAYLLDADEGGHELCEALRCVGIQDNRIFTIPDSESRGLVVEDLVDPTVYVTAVNAGLHLAQGPSVSFPMSALPVAGRFKAVAAWCESQGYSVPSKRLVAYRIVEQGADRSIVANEYITPLQELFASISAALRT